MEESRESERSRRSVLRVLGSTAVVSGLSFPATGRASALGAGGTELQTAGSSTSGEWGQYRATAGNTGYNGSISGPDASTNRWTFTTGPKAANGLVATEEALFTGNDDGRVYAFDRATGEQKWSFHAGDEVLAPTVANGTVYAVNESGMVYALDATDGTEQWSVRAGEESEVPPVVADGTVYVIENELRALDASDGTEQWTYRPELYEEQAPAVAEETVYLAMSDSDELSDDPATSHVVALTTDGTRKWRQELDGAIATPPAVTDDSLYVGFFDGTVSAVSRTDGTKQWSYATDDEGLTTPVIDDDTVYVGSAYNRLYAIGNDIAGTPENTSERGPSSGTSTDTAENTATSSSGGPGFGPLATLGGIGVAGYRYLRRQQPRTDE